MTERVVSEEELRGCFLFESLTDEQLDWLVEHGTVETHDAGVNVYSQDDLAESFYVLLDGEIELVKRLDGTDVVLTTADQPGAYAGATRAFIGTSSDQSYTSSLRTVTSSRLFKLPAEDFAYVLKTWFPMAVHLLDGMFLGLTNAEALVGQREKLIALGALSAGLAHELNNPAAAEVRAAEALSGRLHEARSADARAGAQARQATSSRRCSTCSPRRSSGPAPPAACRRSRRATSKTCWPSASRTPAWRTPGRWRRCSCRPASTTRGWTG